MQCSLCPHVSCRLFRLRTHAVSKHGLEAHSREMELYVKDCQNIRAKGWRITSTDRIIGLMGHYGTSSSIRDMVVRVLNGHLVKVQSPTRGNEEVIKRDCPVERADKRIALGRGRATTKRNLQRRGLIHSFAAENFCELARSYLTVHSEPNDAERPFSRATLYSHVRFIHRYVSWALRKSATANEWETIASTSLAKDFVAHISSVLMPASVRNHTTAMVSLLEGCLSIPALRRQCNPALRRKLRSAVAVWIQLRRNVDKRARSLQRQRITNGEFKSAPIVQIVGYLDKMNETGNIERIFIKLQKELGQPYHAVPTRMVRYWRMTLCVLATIILIQGQRLCVALNVTMKELDSSKMRHGLYVVRVAKHKTSTVSGPAAFVLKPHQFQLFARFSAIRKKMLTCKEELLVSSRGGTPFNLLSHLDRFVSRNKGQAEQPQPKITFNTVRKTIETWSPVLIGRTATHCADAIMAYLCHGKEVTRSHYRFRTDQTVVSQSQDVENAVCQLILVRTAGSHLPKKPLGKCQLNFLYRIKLNSIFRTQNEQFSFRSNRTLLIE